MKKILILTVILALAFAFTACGNEVETTPPDVTPDIPPVEDQVPDEVDEEDDAEEIAEEEEEGIEETGINAGFVRDGGAGSGLDLIIGSGTDVWPFAASQPYGGRVFDPIPGATYRITYNVTSDGVGGPAGWRVRWKTSGYDYPTYTAGDAAVVNNFPAEAYPGVATVIPAHFNIDITPGGTYTLMVEVTLDGNEEYNGLIGNITLRGTGGNSEWFANYMTVELLEDGPGSDVAEVLVEWSRS